MGLILKGCGQINSMPQRVRSWVIAVMERPLNDSINKEGRFIILLHQST
jgi:hypothetical protein